jgi:hypothetical protein
MSIVRASSQQTDDLIQFPTGPLLRPAPEFSEWTITHSYSDEMTPAAGSASKANVPREIAKLPLLRPRRTITTKTGGTVRIVIIDLAGKTTEKWFIDGVQFTKPDGSDVWYGANKAVAAGILPDAYYSAPLPASGFQDLDWIAEGNYAGAIQLGDIKCLVFVPGGMTPDDWKDAKKRKAKLDSAEKVAYIDADSRLPVALRILGEVRQFQFTNPAPTQMLAPPPDLAEQIKKGKEAIANLLRSAARPY